MDRISEAAARLTERLEQGDYPQSGKLGTYKSFKQELKLPEKAIKEVLSLLLKQNSIVVTSEGVFINPKPQGKVCFICKEFKIFDFFGTNKGKRSGGYQAYCKDCTRLNSQLRWHSMTLDEYNRRLEEQNNKCASCHDEMTTPEIDHDHNCCPNGRSCGKCTRGLLCTNCNRLLGWSRDNPVKLQACASYLIAYQGGDA